MATTRAAVCCTQFFSRWRIPSRRSLSRIATIAHLHNTTTGQPRRLVSCITAPRCHTRCFKDIRASDGWRSYSLGGQEDDFDEVTPRNSLDTTHPNELVDDYEEIDVDFDEETSVGGMHLDAVVHSGRTLTSSSSSAPPHPGGGSTVSLTDSSPDSAEQDPTHSEDSLTTTHQPNAVSSTVSPTDVTSELAERNQTHSEDSLTTNHQPDQSSTAVADASKEDQSGTLDLSNLKWSEDGIVIYPKIHFGTETKKDRPPLTTWKDKVARMQEHNIQGLLQNIHRSRSKKNQVVVKERRHSVMSAEEMVEFLRSENARDIVVIELPREVDYVRYFIVCSGMGSRHLGRMADNLVAEMRGVRLGKEKRKIKVEGRDSEDWMAVDSGGMVVHFMLEEVRRKYELEKLWALGEQYDDQSREMKADMLSEEDLMMLDMMEEYGEGGVKEAQLMFSTSIEKDLVETVENDEGLGVRERDEVGGR